MSTRSNSPQTFSPHSHGKVALAIDRGSPVLSGIIEHLQTSPRWACALVSPTGGERFDADRAEGSGAGLIIELPNGWTGGPPRIDPQRVICIGPAPSGWTGFSTVEPDYAAAGRLAAEHLLNRGLQRVGVVGDELGLPAPAARSFADRVREAGLELIDLPQTIDPSTLVTPLRHAVARADGRPVGLFAGDDQQAMELVSLCLAAGLAIPEQVAVLGMGNHPTICQLAGVPLSSVDPDWHEVGRAAAKLLDQRLNQPASQPHPVIQARPMFRVELHHMRQANGVGQPVVHAAN